MATGRKPADDLDAALTIDEVARMFGYESRSLWKLIHGGFFPHPRKLGTRQFYTRQDVNAINVLLGRWHPDEGCVKEEDPEG